MFVVHVLQDLVVVLFTADVELAVRQVRSYDIFPADYIHSLDALNAF